MFKVGPGYPGKMFRTRIWAPSGSGVYEYSSSERRAAVIMHHENSEEAQSEGAFASPLADEQHTQV
jgi:hypothetical protein